MREDNSILLENTRFIFPTNFKGDPEKSDYGSPARVCNIIVPDMETVDKLRDAGVTVKVTKPREGFEDEYEPTYYIKAQVKYRDRYGEPVRNQPIVKLWTDDGERCEDLDENTVGRIDDVYVLRVNAKVSPYAYDKKDPSKVSAYISVLYVEQDETSDPFARRFARN